MPANPSALRFALASAGSNIAARMAIIEITTSNFNQRDSFELNSVQMHLTKNQLSTLERIQVLEILFLCQMSIFEIET